MKSVKRFALAALILGLAAVVSSPVSADKAELNAAKFSGAQYLSGNCAAVCRACIQAGETCGICGPNCCGCN